MGIDRGLFIEDVSADCLCAICQEVLANPKETLTCQHAFCDECIMSWLEKRKSCPVCRCPLSQNDLVPLHRIWKDKLNKMQLRCVNHHGGCKEVVMLYQLEKHYEVCSYVRIPCPHSPCGEIIKRGQIKLHVENCCYRKVTCPTCQLQVTALDIKTHECISALRTDFLRQLDKLKQEYTDRFKTMHRDYQNLKQKLNEQEAEIGVLKSTIKDITSNRKQKRRSSSNTLHLPTINVTETGLSIPHPVPLHGSMQRTSQSSTGSTLALPRLAPLHTRMSLSRNSSNHSGLYKHFISVTMSDCAGENFGSESEH